MSIPIQVVLLALVLAAGLYDLRIRKIPNWLSAGGLLAGLIANALLLPQGWTHSLLGMLSALAVYLPLYLIRGMGAGDVKLMAAVGAIAGPADWLQIFLLTALVGGFASLLLVIGKRRLQETLSNIGTLLSELLQRRLPAHKDKRLDVKDSRALRMPHGAFIASGSMLFLYLTRVA